MLFSGAKEAMPTGFSGGAADIIRVETGTFRRHVAFPVGLRATLLALGLALREEHGIENGRSSRCTWI